MTRNILTFRGWHPESNINHILGLDHSLGVKDLVSIKASIGDGDSSETHQNDAKKA